MEQIPHYKSFMIHPSKDEWNYVIKLLREEKSHVEITEITGFNEQQIDMILGNTTFTKTTTHKKPNKQYVAIYVSKNHDKMLPIKNLYSETLKPEDTHLIVKRVYELRNEGKNIREISKRLNLTRYKTNKILTKLLSME